MVESSSQALNNPATSTRLELYQSELSSLESLFVRSETLDEGQKFLRFQLCPNNTALLAVDEVTAVLTIVASDVLPVPHMPACVLGIYNWRGEVLWLTDLASQIGFDRTDEPDQQLTSFMAIVVQLEGQLLGLAVPEVYDIEQHDPQHLHSSPDLFPSNLSPFMTGYLTSDRSTVLSVAAILQDPQLQIHGLN
ncbi:MAG: chemotaxis protein CheW [Phormidesmis sp. CAN_BIN36]|nr:chemotaxis protein CheW [Phormidesmis sp. CAN_BIN36]